MEASRWHKLYSLVLPLQLLFTAPYATRRRRDDVRNARVIHFLIQSGQILLGDFLDLRRSVIHQRRQFRELFFLVGARCGRKPVQVIQQVLHLNRERVGLPFERRPRVPQPLPFADVLLRDGVHFFLQFIGGFDDIVGDFRRAGFARFLLPLLARGLQRYLDAFDRFAVLIRGLGHGIELSDHFAARRAVRGQNHDACVFFDHDFLRGFLVSGLDLDGVFSRLDERPARPESISRRDFFQLLGSRLCGRIRTQIPVCAVDARRARPVQLSKQFPVFVEHRDFNFAFLLFRGVALGLGLRLLLGRVFLAFFVFVFLWRFRWHGILQVVAQNRAVRRILCGERFLPPAPTAVAQVPGRRRPGRKECQG